LAPFLDTKLSIFSESFSERIVVDLKLSHAIILCKENGKLLSTVLRTKGGENYHTYSISRNSDEAANVEGRCINCGGYSPMETSVIGSCDYVNPWYVFVHGCQDQLQFFRKKEIKQMSIDLN